MIRWTLEGPHVYFMFMSIGILHPECGHAQYDDECDCAQYDKQGVHEVHDTWGSTDLWTLLWGSRACERPGD